MVGAVQKLCTWGCLSSMRISSLLLNAEESLCCATEKWYKQLKSKDSGAVTAEYAVVLIAATGFAALLVAVLKSDAVRNMLNDLVKRALHIE